MRNYSTKCLFMFTKWKPEDNESLHAVCLNEAIPNVTNEVLEKKNQFYSIF